MASNGHGIKSFRLYQGHRKIELHDKTKRDIPGPGSYRIPSDFGFYANQTMIPLTDRSSNYHEQQDRKTKSFVRVRSTNLMQANLKQR